MPADGGMSAWLPIRVRSVPVRTGGVLRLDVSLPPGSDKGPRILRRVLRRSGRGPIRSGGRGWRSPICGTVRPSTVTGCGQPGRAWRGIQAAGW